MKRGDEKPACLRPCSRAGHSGSGPGPSSQGPLPLPGGAKPVGRAQPPRHPLCLALGWGPDVLSAGPKGTLCPRPLQGLDEPPLGLDGGAAGVPRVSGSRPHLGSSQGPSVRMGVGFSGPEAPLKSGDAIPPIPGCPRSAGTSFSLRNTTWPLSLWVTQDWACRLALAGVWGGSSCRRPGFLHSRGPSVTPRSPARRLASAPASPPRPNLPYFTVASLSA